MKSIELKIPPLILTILFALIMWAGSNLFPGLDFEMPFRFLISGIFFLAGTGVSLAGIYQFRKSRTTVNPMSPDESSFLVKSGVYQISRNPMYLGFLLYLCSWSVILSNLIGFFFLPFFIFYIDQFQINPEERVLSEKFEDEFREYKTTVRRWI